MDGKLPLANVISFVAAKNKPDTKIRRGLLIVVIARAAVYNIIVP